MSEKLNKQYFKTREEHEKKISPYAWGFIALLLLSFIIAIVNAVKEDPAQKAEAEAIKKSEAGIIRSLKEAPKTTKHTKIEFEDLDFEIELHENLNYEKYPDQNFVIVHSLDSLKLSYFIGEIPESMKTGDVALNWKSQLLLGNASYQFRDSIDFTFMSVKDNIETQKGFYKIDKAEDTYFIIQASIIDKAYDHKFDDMMSVVNSFRRLK